MKAKTMTVMAAVAAALIWGAESSAQGRAARAGGGQGQGIQTRSQVMTQSTAQSAVRMRPEGSQRRDGSFLNTGRTANGSASRPGNGRGVMDGTGIDHPRSTAP